MVVIRRMLMDKKMQTIADRDISYITGEWNIA